MKNLISSKEFIGHVNLHINYYIKNKEISSFSEKEEMELYWILRDLMNKYGMINYTMDYKEPDLKDNKCYIIYKCYNPYSMENISIYVCRNDIYYEKFILQTKNYTETLERKYNE